MVSVLISNKGFYFNNKIWFISRSDNWLISIDISTGMICFVDQIRFKQKENRIASFYIGNENVIFFPDRGNEIVTYNLYEKKQKSFSYDINNFFESGIPFLSYALWENHFYAFPCNASVMLDLDVLKMNISYSNILVDSFNSYVHKETNNYFAGGCYQDNEKIYLPARGYDFLVEYNLKTNNHAFLEFHNYENISGYRIVQIVGDEIYLINMQNYLLIYNLADRKFKKRFMTSEHEFFLGCLKCGDCLVIIPWEGEVIYRLDCCSKEVESIFFPSYYKKVSNLHNYKMGMVCCESKDAYFFLPHLGNLLIIINKKIAQIDFIPLKYSNTVLDYLFSKDNKILFESNKTFENIENSGIQFNYWNYINFLCNHK